jgi:NifU-like protein involved in Fe-S cluster formation
MSDNQETSLSSPVVQPEGTPNMVIVGRCGVQGEGPYMSVSFHLQEGRIARASFETYGCPWAIACGDWLTGWMNGKTPAQVSVIDSGDLILMLGGVPLGKEHTAALAINALRDGLRQLPEEARPPAE